MNFIQRFLLRLAARFNPRLRNLFKTAGGTLERLETELTVYRDRYATENREVLSRLSEMQQAQAMNGAGPMLREASAGEARNGVFREAIADLELALEDRGWKREQALASTEFSRYGIGQIMLITRLYKIKNPLVKRAIEISALYVWGRGYEISSDDPDVNDIVQANFMGRANAPVLSLNALMEHEEALWTDGNIFFVASTDEKTGEVIWRTIDPTEILDIITDPDDGAVPMLYHRQWSSQTFDANTGVTQWQSAEAWYPAIQYDLGALPRQVKGKAVETTPVLHFKVGGLPKWHFGCPLAYPLIDWARAVKRFLENWATITDALAFFAWNVETQGGAPAIAALKATFATSLATGGTSIETNPTPVAGSSWISGPGNKVTPMKTAGMTTGPEECRRLVLMLCSGAGWPETFFGDASVGTVATAQSLDRPTELKILASQERWREKLQYMARYVVERSAKAPKGKLYEVSKAAGKPQDKEIKITVSFPSVLEHSMKESVSAIVEAMTLNGFESTGIDQRTGFGLLLAELGVENAQDVLEAMLPEDEYEDLIDRTEQLAFEKEQALTPPPPPASQPGGTGTEGPAGAAPHVPSPRKPRPKRVEAATLERAVAALVKASEALKVRRAA
jgi:hypothetical protein